MESFVTILKKGLVIREKKNAYDKELFFEFG